MQRILFTLIPGFLLAQAPVTYRISTVAGVPWSIAGPAQAPNVMFKTPFGVGTLRAL